MVDAYLASVPLSGLSVENLQARVRGTLLMALSNEHGHLVLTTGNKSELATGFSTLYGDSAGGFAPIKDVPKSLVWDLARWRNARRRTAARGRSRRTASRSRRRPSSRPGSSTATDCRRTTCWTRCSTPTSSTTAAAPSWWPRASTASSSTGSSGWSTRPSTSAGRTRRGRRSPVAAFGRDRRLPITSRWREQAAPDAPGAPRGPARAGLGHPGGVRGPRREAPSPEEQPCPRWRPGCTAA